MNTHQPENEKLIRLTVSKEDEVAIRQRADRVGKQLGEVAANLISEIMITILSGKIHRLSGKPQAARQPFHLQAVVIRSIATRQGFGGAP